MSTERTEAPWETPRGEATAVDKALQLAALGLHVGPAFRRGRSKGTTTPKGFYDYSTDPDTIRDLYARYGGNEVGVWAGPSGIQFGDIDVAKENGFRTLDNQEIDYVAPFSYSTPSGGQHIVYATPEGQGELGPAAPIRGMPGVDRRSGNSLAIWYGPVPTAEEWKTVLNTPAPDWLQGPTKNMTSTTRTERVHAVEDADVSEWLRKLTGGPVQDELLSSTEHYDEARDALLRLAIHTRMFPTWPGGRATFEALADGYIDSPVSSTPEEDRPGKILGMLKWVLGATSDIGDYTGALEWAGAVTNIAKTTHLLALQAEEEAQAESHGWEPEDFSDVLDGSFEMTEPTVLRREDGVCLFYPGMVNELHGASESGKSWIAQYAAVQQVNAGHKVVYLDYESARNIVVGRMRLMGAKKDKLLEHFKYYRPDSRPTATVATRELFKKVASEPASLVVIDGVTEALAQAGLASKDNDDIPKFYAELPKALARGTGAAVVLIDHIAKATGEDARHALGAQHKLAAIDGAAYLIDIDRQPALGRVGQLLMKVAKDRNSFVRQNSDPDASGRMALSAEVELDSSVPGATHVRVKAWSNAGALAKIARVRSTELEAVLAVYREHDYFSSAKKVREAYQAMHGADIDGKKLKELMEDLEERGQIAVDRSGSPKVGYPSKLVVKAGEEASHV